MKNKIADDFCSREGLSWENDYAKEAFLEGFSVHKKLIDKILLDILNKYRSDLSNEQRIKLDKTLNEDKIATLEAKIEALLELQNKLK